VVPTHYEALGVEPTATADEIKRAWKRVARESHPDRNPGDPAAEARFKLASDAWTTLQDPRKRELYDEWRNRPVEPDPPPPPPRPRPRPQPHPAPPPVPDELYLCMDCGAPSQGLRCGECERTWRQRNVRVHAESRAGLVMGYWREQYNLEMLYGHLGTVTRTGVGSVRLIKPSARRRKRRRKR
jgi:hypothetical protein